MRRNYDFYSFFLIPALTFWLLEGFSLTGTNFSVIGNRGGRKLLFLLWGALIGNYFYLYVKDLMELGNCRDKWARFFLSAAFFCFICGIGIPYLPKLVPVLSRIHILAAFSGPVLLFGALFRFLLTLERQSGRRLWGQRLVHLFFGMSSFGLLFWFEMVTGLLELFLTLGICLYLSIFQIRVEALAEYEK